MDRTGWMVVIACCAALMGVWAWNSKQMREVAAARQAMEQSILPPPGQESAAPAEGSAPPGEGTEAPAPSPAELSESAPAPAEPPVAEQRVELRSKEVLFEFTSQGGGIAEAHLLKHTAHPSGDLFLNHYSSQPVGTVTRGAGLPAAPEAFAMEQPEPGALVFTAVNDAKLQLRKTYRLTEGEGGDPYVVSLDLEITNVGEALQQSSDYFIYTGSMTFMHPKEGSLYLKYNWSNDGDIESRDGGWFDGKKFLGFQSRGPSEVLVENVDKLLWSGANNQFYASLVIPDQAGPGRIWARRFPVDLEGYEANGNTFYGLHGGVSVPEFSLQPGQSVRHRYLIYMGPREYPRLDALGHRLDGIMHYDDMPLFGGMFGVIPLVSKSLLRLMVWLHDKVHNWGVAILLITFFLRLLIWPLHARSTATMKKMSLLAPKINELKAKYESDPQRMQQETMKLYRDYGVNPLGGCLPVFLQLPVFLGFYKMLQSAVELRNEGFLWVKDLSMPDTLFTIPGVPIFGSLPFNPLPLLMAVTMLLQMAVAPKAGDRMQQRIFMFMPLIFLVICYNFASALALYWTGQNIFAIGQTWLMNRRGEPVLEKRKTAPRLTSRSLAAGPEASKSKKKRPRTGG